MITEPIISIVMPAYNAQKYIAESIESVLMQTYQNWELIIVDDGSTDGTAAIISKFQQLDPRIRYFYQQNSRQGRARNLAIKNANGIYIAFLDADDLWLPQKLEISLHEIAKGSYTLFFTDCYIFERVTPTAFTGLKTMQVKEAVYAGRPAILLFLQYNQVPNLTVIVKKEALVAAGEFLDKIVAEEYEMWLRLLANGAVFKSIATPLSAYRVHEESITAADRHATFEVVDIIKEFGKAYPIYFAETKEIAAEKIKYWLYNGANRTGRQFRTLIKGIYSLPLSLLFNSLSYVMPIDQLRKIVIRLC